MTALAEIASRWRCEGCGYVRYFTKPQTVEACDDCPKCKGTRWVPGGEGTPPLSD